ncbi:hypothetical protein MLD38_033173 [Melastoma candidum]|uniref:Uncharacterized protein n=1 Tax=Melastoma candidum TaxID=119954 RepID=A0ACB9M9L7_9MYRT|nr:hypothetical protein MLD38_033173 [Melastoma candidum]
MNPILLVSENGGSANYLSLRRFWWMCRVLKGGAMAGTIHMHGKHRDPLVHEFIMRLLRRVCSLLFEMVRSWVLEGELEDIFAEFFVVCQLVKAESLWREGYCLHMAMLPSFISPSLAQPTEAASAAGTTTGRGSLGYGETDALECLVDEAAKRIDKHLLYVMYNRYQFKEHCLAIKRLPDCLKADDPGILDRLRVKMMPHGTGDRGWDVFSLEYDPRVPLDTIFTELVMTKYLKIFNFLWKLRRVEHALFGAWKTMKPNCITSQALWELLSALRRCQVLWNEMNHFVTNLQYYIMFELLEVSWSNFSNEMEVAKDLNDLLAAHDKYLNSIFER